MGDPCLPGRSVAEVTTARNGLLDIIGFCDKCAERQFAS